MRSAIWNLDPKDRPYAKDAFKAITQARRWGNLDEWDHELSGVTPEEYLEGILEEHRGDSDTLRIVLSWFVTMDEMLEPGWSKRGEEEVLPDGWRRNKQTGRLKFYRE